jgi:hypothetical protein
MGGRMRTVKRFEKLGPNDLFESFHGLLERLGAPYIISRRKSVTGVNANTHPLLIHYSRNNIPQVLPARADYITLAGHIFQNRDHTLRFLVASIQLRRDSSNGFGAGLPVRVPRVEVIKLYP